MHKKMRLQWRNVNSHLRDLPLYRTRVPGGYLVTRVFFVPYDREFAAELAEEVKAAIAQRDYDGSGGERREM